MKPRTCMFKLLFFYASQSHRIEEPNDGVAALVMQANCDISKYGGTCRSDMPHYLLLAPHPSLIFI